MSEATIEDADFEPVEEATKPVEGPVERVRREVESYVARIKAKAQNSISKAEEKAAKKLAAVEEREAEKQRKAALKEQQRAVKEAAALQAAREVKQTSSVNIARPKAKSSFSFVDFLRDIFTSSKAKAARREARREAKTLELLEAREKFFKRDDAFFENGPKTPEVNGQDSWHAKSAQKRAVRHAEAAQKEASNGATTRRFFANKNISADAYLDAVRLKRASTPTKVAAGVAAAFAATEVADEVSLLAHTYKRAVPSEDVHVAPKVTAEEPLHDLDDLLAELDEDELLTEIEPEETAEELFDELEPEVTEVKPLLSREELDALLHEAPDADEALQKAARNGFNKPYDPKAVYVANLFAEEARKPRAIEAAPAQSADEPQWETVPKNEQKLLENEFPKRNGIDSSESDLEFNADGSVSTDLVLAKDLVKDLADVSETPYLQRLEELARDDQSHALVKRMAASALCKATQLKDSNAGEKGVQLAEELAERSLALFPKYIKRYEFLRFKKENPVSSNSPDAVYVANLFAEEAKKPKAIVAAPAQSADEPEWEAVPEAEQMLLENKFSIRNAIIAPSELS